jgi:replicative DNA helicase
MLRGGIVVALDRLPTFGDRIPPQNLEAEQAVLGSMLIERPAVEKAAEILKPEDFYRDAHRYIFEAMLALAERDEPVDLITLPDELKSRGQFDTVGGFIYLQNLMEAPSTAANVEYYARLVEEKAILRRLMDAGTQIQGLAHSEFDAVDDVVDRAERIVFEVGQRRMGQFFHHLRPLLDEELDRIEKRYEDKGAPTGRMTPFDDLNYMTSGLQPSDLIIVAARPSMGKTTLSVQFAQHIAMHEKLPVAIFSLEMAKEQLVTRMICCESRVNAHALRNGFLQPDDWKRIGEGVSRLADAPIYIDDTPDVSAMEMRAKCRRLKAEHGLGLVLIDYMQLMRAHGRAENRNQELSDIARACKGLARELKVPVIALSQLSRAVESRPDKRPMLSDLRECVTGDTLLTDADTGRQVPIREIRPGMRVLGMDSRQKIGAYPVRDVWSTGVKPVFTLITRTGRRVTASGNHPFLTATGWKRLEELKAGDVIASAMRLPEYGSEKPARAAFCRLLGYLTGDGTFQVHRSVGFCGSDDAAIADAVGIVQQQFPEITWRVKKRDGTYTEGDLSCVYANGYGKPGGNPLREWLRCVGVYGGKDSNKFVPDYVFEAGQVGAREFLAGYFATDGCVKTRQGRWGVHVDTVSLRLAADVQSLLLRLGVVSTIGKGAYHSKSTQPIYRVYVLAFAANLRRFADAVKPRGRKGELLDRMVQGLPQTTTSGSLFSLPVEVSQMMFEKTKHLRQQGRKLEGGRRLYWKHQGKRPNRASCADVAAKQGDTVLAVWAGSDLLWEPITEIIPAGEQETFDIKVGCANFLANGLVAHNSGAIEAEADVVMFIYRDSYYKMKEAVDSEEETQERRQSGEVKIEEAEIIIAKQRNGPTGKVVVGFIKEFTRFETLDRTHRDYSDEGS